LEQQLSVVLFGIGTWAAGTCRMIGVTPFLKIGL
jgi:hypothetical protein